MNYENTIIMLTKFESDKWKKLLCKYKSLRDKIVIKKALFLA